MGRRFLKAKRGSEPTVEGSYFVFPESTGSGAAARATRRRGRLRSLAPAVILSLVLHGLLAATFLLRPTGGGSSDVVETRVDSWADDWFVTFAETAPAFRRAGPEALDTSAAAALPPTLVPRSLPDLPSTAPPLEPLFSQRLRQGAPTGEGGPGKREPGGKEGGQGGRATTAFFQLAAAGGSVVYVIDRSTSMGINGGLAVARRELVASIQQLAPGVSFQVIAYNRSADPLALNAQKGLVPASPANKSQAVRLVESLRPEGGTDHIAALRRALLLRPDALFFLTDADALSEEEVRAVTRLNQGRTVIHAVEITPTPKSERPSPLQRLAQANRGRYQAVCPDPVRGVARASRWRVEENFPASNLARPPGPCEEQTGK